MTRGEWINQRTRDLLADPTAAPDLIDEIMRHNGLASRAFRTHMLAWLCGKTVAIRERAADQATNTVEAFAFMRAQHEYDRRPLCAE